MNLDTYESMAVQDIFVTLPSREAASAIGTVDRLGALRLRLFRGDYTLAEGEDTVEFRALVTERIALVGYAIHGFELAFVPMAGPCVRDRTDAAGKEGHDRPSTGDRT